MSPVPLLPLPDSATPFWDFGGTVTTHDNVLTEGPRYVRSRQATRWHRTRSAVRYPPMVADGVELLPDRVVWRHWCGTHTHSSRGIGVDDLPADEPLCGTCEGRAVGAGQGSEVATVDGELLFTPHGIEPPKVCPGSQTPMYVEEPGGQSVGRCLPCGQLVRLRGGGGWQGWSWYGPQNHPPGPDLVEPCRAHRWGSLVVVKGAYGSGVTCRCRLPRPNIV